MLEQNQMNQVIEKITSKFAELYSYFPEREKTGIEYNGSIQIEDELRMGYCLHFAALLKEIFPEGHIIWGNVIDHYIFYYHQNFYEYRGLIYHDQEKIEILPQYFIPLKDLKVTPVKNVSLEFLQANTIYAEQDPIWIQIKPYLISTAKEEIEKVQNNLNR